MKSRITNKPALKQTKEEMMREFEIESAEMEKENIQLEKIIKSGKKEKVNSELYYNCLEPGECRYCMNFNFKDESCKKNMPFVNPWYAKDNGILDDCQEWDYVYIIDDEK